MDTAVSLKCLFIPPGLRTLIRSINRGRGAQALALSRLLTCPQLAATVPTQDFAGHLGQRRFRPVGTALRLLLGILASPFSRHKSGVTPNRARFGRRLGRWSQIQISKTPVPLVSLGHDAGKWDCPTHTLTQGNPGWRTTPREQNYLRDGRRRSNLQPSRHHASPLPFHLRGLGITNVNLYLLTARVNLFFTEFEKF